MANQCLGTTLRQMLRRFGPADSSDAQLLARFDANHDQGAFAELVQRHGSMV
jgi:hypothetical protein